MAQDITTLRNVGARLQARLLSTPPGTHSVGTEQVLRRGLQGLLPILNALAETVQSSIEAHPKAAAASQATQDAA